MFSNNIFSTKRVRQLALPVLSLCAMAFATSCVTEEGPTETNEDTNPFIVTMAIQGSEGGFTYYTVPFDEVMSGSLSAEGEGIEQAGYFDFTQIDNTIYSIGGLGDVSVAGITENENGNLVLAGDAAFSNSISDIIKADENTLVALEMSSTSDVVKLHTLDANTSQVTNTKQHPVADITELEGPSYSGMSISGGQLFVSYYISDPTTYQTPYTDAAQIAVYSYPELEFQKVITDERTGPIGGFNTKSGLIKDENGDVYALSHSNPANGYSQTTKDGAILRINNGETTFDQDYFFDVEAATSGKNIAHLKYLGNGKAFAEINMQENADQTAWSDSPLKSAIIDLYKQTVTYIDEVPEHAGVGRRLPALYNENYIYICIPEESGLFVYKIDVENQTATKGAEVQANFVAGFFRF